MKDYTIEFSMKHNNLHRSVTIVCEANNDNELIELCDHIYGKFFLETRELVLFFFPNKDDARRFTYKMMVEEKNEEIALKVCKWLGYLKNDILYSNIGPSVILKQYCRENEKNKTKNIEIRNINN